MAKYLNNDDLRVFLLWIKDIRSFYDISEYRLLKTCNIRKNFLADLRRQLRNDIDRQSNLHLYFLIHISKFYPYPLDIKYYLDMIKNEESNVLGVSPKGIEFKTIDERLTKAAIPKHIANKKAANKLILTASV